MFSQIYHTYVKYISIKGNWVKGIKDSLCKFSINLKLLQIFENKIQK